MQRANPSPLDGELLKQAATMQQRSVNAFVEWLDGFNIMVEQARAGNPAARQNLAQLQAHLRQVDAALIGLTIANGPGEPKRAG